MPCTFLNLLYQTYCKQPYETHFLRHAFCNFVNAFVIFLHYLEPFWKPVGVCVVSPANPNKRLTFHAASQDPPTFPKRKTHEQSEKRQSDENAFLKRKKGILGGSWAALGRFWRLSCGYVFAWSAAAWSPRALKGPL